ncbi:hypothetical protein Ndes2526B_g08183 [Nannochloris sp. 'desiccata']|nr:hypothetical protein NADE_007353 [Chlorella desiccata (nom. nud.)]
MGLSRLFCCFGPLEEAGTPRGQGSDQEFEPEVAGDTPSAASCSIPAGPYKFIFDKDDAVRVTGLNNSGSKYAIDKHVELHSTPYEERLERALQEEELAMARRREVGAE